MWITPKPRHLFISPSITSRPLSQNALSYLLRETILLVCNFLHEDHMLPTGVSTRCLGHCYSQPLEELVGGFILEAASWESPSVFVMHYLKDKERSDGVPPFLGPLVATGSFLR